MTWLRLDDGFDNDPALLHVARTRGEADRVLGIVTAMMLYCARHLTDGFLPRLVVVEHVRSAALLAKLTAAGQDTPGLLHPRGSTCECLDGRDWPPTGGDYAVHHYLKSNPTRAEHDVNRAKAAELRNRELLAAVRARDGLLCRYCGTSVSHSDRRGARGLVYDHVDPAIAAGAANLVVACRGCNSRKGPRTPQAAGMVLLSRPGSDLDPISESDPGPTTGVARDGTGRANDRYPEPTTDVDPGDAGPNGYADPVGPAQMRASSVFPDPYRRSAITGVQPDTFAGLPDEEDYPPPPGGI